MTGGALNRFPTVDNPIAHVISGSHEGLAQPPFCQTKGLLQLFTLNNVAE